MYEREKRVRERERERDREKVYLRVMHFCWSMLREFVFTLGCKQIYNINTCSYVCMMNSIDLLIFRRDVTSEGLTAVCLCT